MTDLSRLQMWTSQTIAILALLLCGPTLTLHAQSAHGPSKVQPEDPNYFRIEQVNRSDTKSFVFVPIPLRRGQTIGNKAADKLVRSANESFFRKDYQSANEQLRQAEALSPNQLGLWATHSFLDIEMGDLMKATDDLEHEMFAHPEQTHLYPLFTGLLEKLKRRQELEKAYVAWFDHNGTALPVTQLMLLWIDDGNLAGALQVGEAVSGRLSPTSENYKRFRLTLAQVRELLGGEEEHNKFNDVLSHTDRAALEDFASDLGDGSLDLSLAEDCAREALRQFADESSRWRSSGQMEEMVDTSRQIIQTWGTLGWVLMHEGELTDASGYLGADWRNFPNLDTGKRFGELQEKLGNSREAVSIYTMALATVPASERMQDMTITKSRATDLAAQIASLKASHPDLASSGAEADIEPIYRIPTTLSDTEKRVDYYLFLQNGHLESLVAADGTTSLPSPDLAVPSTTLLCPPFSGGTIVRKAHLECNHGCVLRLIP